MAAFLELISRYVADNDIIRRRFGVKSTGVNSVNKLYIIQNTTNYRLMISLPPKGLKMDDLIKKWNK
jgi:ATP-dependent DNA helicase RecQ